MNKMQCSDFGQAETRGKWSGKCRQVLSVWLRANANAHSIHSVVSPIEMIVAAATSHRQKRCMPRRATSTMSGITLK